MASAATAHTTIWNIWLNDVDQGVGNSAAGYIRSPPNNNPVKDITSSDMTCNVNNVATAKTVSVAAGDKVTLEWHHDSNSASDDIIASSHKGPVMVYIAPTESNGAGDVWVKLAEDGYDGTTWAVDTLIANKGKHSVTLPSSLAAGKYLLRGEIIALHEADTAYSANSARGAQFYMECVQIEVTSGGSTTLPSGVAIPGAYTYTDPGVVFNLYGSFTSYTIPGPAVWDGTTGGSASTASSSAAPVASSSTAAVASSSAAPVASSSSVSTAVAVATSSAATKPTTTAAAVQTPASSSAVAAVPTTLATSTKSSTCGSASAAAIAGAVAKWGQCGGTGHTGSTTCASGTTCTVQNPYYSQCL
ncbi:putative endo-beta-1,4-glucanase D [Coleophoma cylindrospora]|uniref:AA9 family lytic polysaccharide monooxygenase n=1 Tax=Coleophoma cylindrospora TaxID=1849047 RepID=A0A3D8RG45_9HELO|nr:putative endo-beta-1,4-glucanase D [Coleophoma cylindrospora]